jgi:hypothetical protein
MATTDKLNITLLEAGQKNKETTINEGFTALDSASGSLNGVYSTAGLPSAGDYENSLVLVNDISGSELWLAYSDGTNWKQIVQVNGTTIV